MKNHKAMIQHGFYAFMLIVLLTALSGCAVGIKTPTPEEVLTASREKLRSSGAFDTRNQVQMWVSKAAEINASIDVRVGSPDTVRLSISYPDVPERREASVSADDLPRGREGDEWRTVDSVGLVEIFLLSYELLTAMRLEEYARQVQMSVEEINGLTYYHLRFAIDANVLQGILVKQWRSLPSLQESETVSETVDALFSGLGDGEGEVWIDRKTLLRHKTILQLPMRLDAGGSDEATLMFRAEVVLADPSNPFFTSRPTAASAKPSIGQWISQRWWLVGLVGAVLLAGGALLIIVLLARPGRSRAYTPVRLGAGSPAGEIHAVEESPSYGLSAQRVPYQPSIPMRRAQLRVLNGPLAGRTLWLSSDDVLLGREPSCTLRIPDPAVSRRHARLRYAQGAWFLQDQNSTGGTLVNNRRVMAVRLHDRDQITVGNTLMEFRVGQG